MSSLDPITSALTRKGGYNIVLGLTLGATCWHGLIAGPIAYKTFKGASGVPSQTFGLLQSKLFPPYFTLQTLGSALLLWWHRKAGRLIRSNTNGWLLAIMTATGALNMLVVGPWTTGIMKVRQRLERREGKTYQDRPASREMTVLNKRFAVAHSVSSLANMAFTAAIVAHTLSVGEHGPFV